MISQAKAVLDAGRCATRAFIRLAAAAIVLAGLAVTVTFSVIVLPSDRRPRAVRAVVQLGCRALLGALGITRTSNGSAPTDPALFVANHRSWLDIPLALALAPCTLIAKREVKAWPIIGRVAKALDVIFIDRRRPRDLLRVIPAVERTLQGGTSVLVFPEGTTTNGESVLPFRSGLFEAAERVGATVVPWSLSGSARIRSTRGEREADAAPDALCWYGTESLIANLPRVAMLTEARLHVQVGAPIRSGGGRKATCASARSRVVLAVACANAGPVRRVNRGGNGGGNRGLTAILRGGVNRPTAGWG